jgi:GT2 family glycosyltransferase
MISICMVSLNAWEVLRACLNSLGQGAPGMEYDIIVVDNASSDGTPERLRAGFPYVRLIRNDRNVGFTRANNQAIAVSKGDYLLWLNTDTILRPDTVSGLASFLELHPKAGVVGPKVLNPDGTFQSQCRRSLPTPLASLLYMLKLDRFFPENRLAGRYLMSHLPVDQANQVDSVSGCCLMTRREVLNAIGPLDEDFFGFGEDIDWCVRAKNAGWEVWYFPGSEIIHLKGQGGVHSRPYHKVWGIHQAMWVFYKKHLRVRYRWPVTALVWLGMIGGLVLSTTGLWARRTVNSVRQK